MSVIEAQTRDTPAVTDELNDEVERLNTAIMAAGSRLNRQVGSLLALDEESEKTRAAEQRIAVSARELEHLRHQRDQLLLDPKAGA